MYFDFLYNFWNIFHSAKNRVKYHHTCTQFFRCNASHILKFLTAFQECGVHSPSTYWYIKIQVNQDCLRFCKENGQLTGVDRGEGQGITLHDGEGMKSCVTISASLKQSLVSPRLKSSTVYLMIYPTQIFWNTIISVHGINYKCHLITEDLPYQWNIKWNTSL